MKKRNNMTKQSRVNEALRLAQVAQSRGKLNNRVTQYLQRLAWLKSQNAQIRQNYAPVGWYTSTSSVPYTNPYWVWGHSMMYSPVRYKYTTWKWLFPWWGNGEYINYWEYIAPNATPMEIWSRTHDDAFMEEWKNISDDIKSWRLYMKDDWKGWIDWWYNKDKWELKSIWARENFFGKDYTFAALDNPNTVYKRQQQTNDNIERQWWREYNSWNILWNPVNRKENQLTLDAWENR